MAKRPVWAAALLAATVYLAVGNAGAWYSHTVTLAGGQLYTGAVTMRSYDQYGVPAASGTTADIPLLTVRGWRAGDTGTVYLAVGHTGTLDVSYTLVLSVSGDSVSSGHYGYTLTDITLPLTAAGGLAEYIAGALVPDGMESPLSPTEQAAGELRAPEDVRWYRLTLRAGPEVATPDTGSGFTVLACARAASPDFDAG